MRPRITLVESMRSIGYSPIYFLLAQDLFAEEGLDVSVRSASSPTEACDLILDGAAQVAFGGPIRIMMNHDRDPDCPLCCFGCIISCDPFVLVGRGPRPQFRFSDLAGLRVAVAIDVPTAWLTFQDDLVRAGIDPNALERVSAPTMAENVERFEAGEVDVVQVFEPFTERLTRSGDAGVWHSFARRGGICYTAFYARRDFVDDNREVCRAMLRALSRAQAAFGTAEPSHIADTILSYFPALEQRSLARAIGSYAAGRLWPSSPRLDLAEFLKLKAAAVSGGFIGSDVAYERIVHRGLNDELPVVR